MPDNKHKHMNIFERKVYIQIIKVEEMSENAFMMALNDFKCIHSIWRLSEFPDWLLK